ncbi:MAG: YfiR family protein [Candidatus Contendobacter sp.]|nr:YfiR family protein [Candidatus Contendobacter sp.]
MALTHFLLGGLLLGGVWGAEFDEYAIKAAYLYNFAKFVEWPPEAFASNDAPLWICIVGANPFGDALIMLSGKRVEDHPVEVRHLPAATGLDQCHIVFIGRLEQGQFKTVLARLARLPVLTVSDINDFARMGGMIGLVEADQRIRFDINLVTAQRANLKLSSQLLKLASIVEQNGGTP